MGLCGSLNSICKRLSGLFLLVVPSIVHSVDLVGLGTMFRLFGFLDGTHPRVANRIFDVLSGRIGCLCSVVVFAEIILRSWAILHCSVIADLVPFYGWLPAGFFVNFGGSVLS